jgi:hypothetical protein
MPVRDDSKALARFTKAIESGFSVDVGILEKASAKHKKKDASTGPITISELAQIHEFGLGQVERSFIRGWADAQGEELLAVLTERAAYCLKRGVALRTGAEQAAVKLAASCQMRMVKGRTYPDISPQTKKRKKSSTPLVDQGILKSAIAGRANIGG